MHARNSEEKLSSTSRQVNCLIQSSASFGSRSRSTDNDPYTDEQLAPAQFDIPGDGSCLFWAITLAYLIPVKDDDASFQRRYKNLFGNDETEITEMDCVRTSIRNYNPLSYCVPKDDVLQNLVNKKFRNRVVDFIENNLDRFQYFSQVVDEQYIFNMRNLDSWGGDPEIQAISLILNCRINVDGQIFPVVSNNEKMIHDTKRITLELFHVNCSTEDAQNANHYNYGLEKWHLEYFRERLIVNTFKLIEKYSYENSKTGMQDPYADHDSNNPGYNSKECHKELESRNAEDIANVIGTKVMNRIKKEAKFEVVCLHELTELLDECQVDCKQVNQSVKGDIIQNMCCLFQNPKHVADIFKTLRNIPDKIELLKYSFIVLKFVIDGLYNGENYDLVLMIANIKEVDSIKNIFLQRDSSDLDVLQFKRTIAQTKNKKGFHKDALEILNSILYKIINVKSLTTSDELKIEDIDTGKFHFSLLISSDIAFTKHLMGKCEESYNEYKSLHDKIMKHLEIKSDKSRLSYKIYKEILLSEKYQSILSLDQEYLNIFHIRSGIAHELLCFGVKTRNSLWNKELKDFDGTLKKAVECFQNAILLQKDDFEIKRIYAEFRQDIGMNMRDIAVVYETLGHLKGVHLQKVGRTLTITCLNETLSYFYKAFEMHSVSLTRPKLWRTQPVNSKSLNNILFILYRIAWTHMTCGGLEFYIDSKAALRNYENALNVFERLYKFQVNNVEKEHDYTLKYQNDIAFINTKLGHLKSRYSKEEASRHYGKAHELYKDLLEIKRRKLGNKNPQTLKFESYVNKTKTWKKELYT